METYRTILCPTDFSPPAEFALQMAAALARDHGARLVLLHVSPPVVVYPGAAFPATSPEDYFEMLVETIRRLEAREPGPGKLRVDPRVVAGNAGPEILRLADELNADLIVMGTYGRTGLRRLLMGSVAEEVLREAKCPVVTVKAPPLAGAADTVEPITAKG
jgi:universal stress protein A